MLYSEQLFTRQSRLHETNLQNHFLNLKISTIENAVVSQIGTYFIVK